MNDSANRAVISDGNVIVSETNKTLLSLKSDLASSSHVNGIQTRINRLSNVNLSFQTVVNEHHNVLRKYQSDVEQAFGGDICSRSPNASGTDINAAIANAVEYARSSYVNHTVIVVEAGNPVTNSIAKELLPKYPDLMFLVDSIHSLVQSIAFYNTHAQYIVGGGVGVVGGVVQPDVCSTQRIRGAIFSFIIFFIVIATVVSRANSVANS